MRPGCSLACACSGLTTDPETPKGQQKHLKGVYVMSKLGQAPAAPQKSRFATREQVGHSMGSEVAGTYCSLLARRCMLRLSAVRQEPGPGSGTQQSFPASGALRVLCSARLSRWRNMHTWQAAVEAEKAWWGLCAGGG